MNSNRKLFICIMTLFTAFMIAISALGREVDYAESVMTEPQILHISEAYNIESESFDILEEDIRSKLTDTETEVIWELTTEVKEDTTEELATTEQPTEVVTEEPKKSEKEKTKAVTNVTKKSVKAEPSTVFVTTSAPVEEITEAVEPELTEAITEQESTEVIESVMDYPEIISEEPTEELTTTEVTTEPVTEEITTEEPATEAPRKSMYYSMSEDEIYTFAALIYLEAGSTSYKCQCAVASVVLNLMVNEGKSLNACIKTPGRFSVANRVYGTKPSSTSLEVARKIATDGPTLPTYVLYFRNNHYFSWAKPYCNIDNVYFSY